MKFEIQTVSWFPTNVFFTKIDKSFCDALKQKVLIDKDTWKKKLNNVNALTTGWNGLEKYEELKELCNFICETILPKIGQSQEWKYNDWEAREAWINFYQKEDFAKTHCHGFSDFCGVLIVDPGEGNLFFSKTEFIQSKTRPYENIKDEKINEEKGTLILFPPYLYHTVKNCENDRITVAMNFTNHSAKEL